MSAKKKKNRARSDAPTASRPPERIDGERFPPETAIESPPEPRSSAKPADEPAVSSPRKWLVPLLCVAVFALSIALYWGSVDNEFIWDDPIVFQRQMPYFDSLQSILNPPASIPQFGIHYYRPVVVISYKVDEWVAQQFWPLEQREQARQITYHSSVVIFHAIATVLVLLTGLLLGKAAGLVRSQRVAASLAAGILFAVHPIHVENVAWMAGRADVICAIFSLAAISLYLLARRATSLSVSLVLIGLCAASALLAMGSKELGVGLLLAIPLLELLLPLGAKPESPDQTDLSRAERRRLAREQQKAGARAGSPSAAGSWLVPALAMALLAVAALIYLLKRKAVLGLVTTPAGRTPISMFDALFGSIGWYIWKSVYPPPQSAFVSDTPGTPLLLLGLLATAACAVWIAWLIAKRSARAGALPPRGENRQVRVAPLEAVLAGLFFATLAPSLAIAVFSISETRLAERYLYLPSAGLCLLAGALLVRVSMRAFPRRKELAVAIPLVLAALIAVPAAWATTERAKVWRTDLDFWSDAVRKSPDEGLPHLHLGMAYGKLGYVERSIEQYQIAYERYNDREGRSKAQNNLASSYLRLQQYDPAIAALKKALEENPRYPTARYNWGLAELNLAMSAEDPAEQSRRINNALSQLQEALRLNPRYVKAHLRYGALLIQLGQVEQGVQHLRRVIVLDESSPEAEDARRRLAALGV